MAAEQVWSQYFKPEVRKQGREYFEEGAVFLSIAADTQIRAFLRVSSGVKVAFTAASIASPSFDVDCSCSSAAKGQLCKHIWATLLETEKKHPDFLDSKRELHKVSAAVEDAPKEMLKAKQSDYRKAQYQRQKQWVKEQKSGKKEPKLNTGRATVPEEVQNALKFFSENGFAMELPLEQADVINARKVLSRIFHPDKGGTHDEALVLNENYEILIAWAGR